jgi:hypothetical protein
MAMMPIAIRKVLRGGWSVGGSPSLAKKLESVTGKPVKVQIHTPCRTDRSPSVLSNLSTPITQRSRLIIIRPAKGASARPPTKPPIPITNHATTSAGRVQNANTLPRPRHAAAPYLPKMPIRREYITVIKNINRTRHTSDTLPSRHQPTFFWDRRDGLRSFCRVPLLWRFFTRLGVYPSRY